MSQPSAVESASFARSSPRCQLWTSLPRLPSGFSRLWSGPATKPSSEIDMWQVVSGIGILQVITLCKRRHRTAGASGAGAAQLIGALACLAIQGGFDEIAVVREGEEGPEVLLVHGGASPASTWSGLEPLRDRWRLVTVHRRGFPPSPPPPEGRQDFDLDAGDLVPLLQSRPHVVAHSYGALGALIAATHSPAQVRSLTLIEPPLFYLLPDDSELKHFQRIGDEVLAHGLDTDPATLREFLRIAGSPVPDSGPLPENVIQAVRRAHGSRSPTDARPKLDVLRDAGTPALVASGAHASFLERAADALAAELHAQRLIAPGAGHFVAAAPGFSERLERFLLSVR
jgi:pimeloyl-ACP methyl ester carboxylesterase